MAGGGWLAQGVGQVGTGGGAGWHKWQNKGRVTKTYIRWQKITYNMAVSSLSLLEIRHWINLLSASLFTKKKKTLMNATKIKGAYIKEF